MSGIMGIRTDNKSGTLGRIYERGSNSNGDYVKFEDGLQICEIRSYVSDGGAAKVWTFPSAFSHEPTCHGSCPDNTSRFAVGSDASDPITLTLWSFFAFVMNDGSSPTRSTTNYNLTAVGRWY